jgi:hypothetical protein
VRGPSRRTPDVAEPRVLRLIEEALDAAAVEPRRDVENGPCRRRDGNAVHRRRLILEVPGAVDTDSLAPLPSAGAGQRDVDGRRVAAAKLPQRAAAERAPPPLDRRGAMLIPSA